MVLLQSNWGRGVFAKPYCSTSGLTSKQELYFTVIALCILLYIIIRVNIKLKDDRKKESKKQIDHPHGKPKNQA